jgi:hypothetical protein
VISRQLFLHEDALFPRQLSFFTRFTAADSIHVWILIKGYINQLCGETPTVLRMGFPAHATNFDGMTVTLIATQRKAAINAPYQYG